MFCPNCGAQIANDSKVCEACGAELSQQTQPVQPVAPQAEFTPRTSPMAIWSLVLGILGFFTCITAIPGLILGIFGLNQINGKPQEYVGKGLATAGIILSVVGVFFFALIAIFAAILFPVFARAKESARKASCLNNLKQCSQALKMYADDYDGMMPSSGVTGVSGTDFCSRLCVDGVNPPNDGVRKTWAQMLSDNMRNRDIVFCPSDAVDHSPAGNPVVSYWYKYANDVAWTSCGKQKMGDYAYESDQIAFFECKGWHFGDTAGLKQGLQINAAFMDTHVETIVLPSNGTAPSTSAPVSDPAGMPGPFEPFYYNTRVDDAGNSVTATDVLSPEVNTGAFIDPSNNYDQL